MRLRIEDTNAKAIVNFHTVIFLGVMQLVW